MIRPVVPSPLTNVLATLIIILITIDF